MKNAPFKFETKFIKKEKLTDEIYTFYFDRVKRGSAEYFDFIPGQYVRLTLRIDNPDGRGSSRYFTISSSPTDLEYFTITTRIIKSSFKKSLLALKSGEKVKVYGPMGYFDFEYKDSAPKILLAGGIGITPFYSLLRFIDAKKLKQKITLFVSFADREEMIFFDELKEVEKRNSNIKVIYTLTKEKCSEFEYGRINEQLIKRYAKDYKDSKFFIVGSEEMEEALYGIVSKMGIKDKNIFKENFSGY